MDLAAVMQAVADRLATITALSGRSYAWPVDSITPPAAVVLGPEQIEYDATYQRGKDRIPLHVGIFEGRASDRSVWKRISAYASGSGAMSVKQVLESGTYTSFEGLSVVRSHPELYDKAGTNYLAWIFELDIIGKGTTP